MSDAPRLAAALGERSDLVDAPGPPPPAKRIVEALLFAAGQPVTAELAAGAIRGLDADEFGQIVDELARNYRRQSRPYQVTRSAEGGWYLELKPRFRAVRERLEGGPREARLTPPTVDVLTLVAYLQPVERSRIDSVRGRDSAGALRQLVRLGLIVSGPAAEGAREPRYRTTGRFLDLLGISRLDDLPRTLDLQQL